jgi:hypothetical protein
LWIVGVILAGLGAMGVVASERGAPVGAVTEARATDGDVGVGEVLPTALYAVAVATRSGPNGEVEVGCTTPAQASALVGEVEP